VWGVLALTVGLVNHLCLDTDPTHVKLASRLLRTTVVRHSTTTTTVVGLSDVLIPSAINRIVVLTTHDRITHDSAPPQNFFLVFDLEMVSFGAFWVVFYVF